MSPASFVLQTSYPVSRGKFVAIAVGCVGIILVSVSGIGLAAESDSHCGYKDVEPDINDTSVMEISERIVNNTNVTGTVVPLREHYCTHFTAKELATALLALMGGSLMWSLSSSKLL